MENNLPPPISLNPNIDPPYYMDTNHPWHEVAIDWNLNPLMSPVLKYVKRYRQKGKPVQDLKKAIKYLEMEIERLGKEAVKNVQLG